MGNHLFNIQQVFYHRSCSQVVRCVRQGLQRGVQRPHGGLRAHDRGPDLREALRNLQPAQVQDTPQDGAEVRKAFRNVCSSCGTSLLCRFENGRKLSFLGGPWTRDTGT